VAINARVHVPQPRRWRSERCGVECDGESISIPHGSRLSRDATEELVTGCTESLVVHRGHRTREGHCCRVLPIGGAAVQS
jgi:hypothetical protein